MAEEFCILHFEGPEASGLVVRGSRVTATQRLERAANYVRFTLRGGHDEISVNPSRVTYVSDFKESKHGY